MELQPKQLTTVKVVQHGLLSRTVFAVDEKGKIWKRLEGFGQAKWILHKKS